MRKLLLIPFWVAAILMLLGNVITFVPGAELPFFLSVACLAAAGLFIANTYYRIASAALIVLAFVWAYQGHLAGVRHQQYLSTNRVELLPNQ